MPVRAAQFATLCAAAVDLFELPLTLGNTEAGIAEQGPGRARQYASAGVFLCAHCHVLLALWDGKESDQLGGTSQVVRFHHHDLMPGYTPRATASRLNLTDDESDLVYHVVCSRDRPDGQPAPGLVALDAFWFTSDEAQPRVREMPARHRKVFAYTNEFSREAQLYAASIDKERYSLLSGEQATLLPPGLWDINQVFCAADWLAIRYQKRVIFTLKAGHICALLTAIGYLTYTDLESTRVSDRTDHRADAERRRHQHAGRAWFVAPQVPRLPHARRGTARAVLLGRRGRHQRQRHQVCARQLPADAGHGTRLDPQRDARGWHRVRHRPE